MFSFRKALLLTALAALAACAPTKRHWKEVASLTDAGAKLHFVVVDPSHVKDRQVYLDAAEALCQPGLCYVGYFRMLQDVPKEQLASEFFKNGGWGDRGELALLVRNTNSGLDRLAFDCNVNPQPHINDCRTKADPTGDQQKTIAARGALEGFGNVKFESPIAEVAKLLGGPEKFEFLDTVPNRSILKAKSDYKGREYDAFYNITSAGFELVLLKWTDFLNEADCKNEANKIADSVRSDYGDEDSFEYYDSTEKSYSYQWAFANKANIRIDNLNMSPGQCEITLKFSLVGG